MFPSIYVPRFYVPRSLCSPILCSPVPCSPIPMFPSRPTYVPRYLCSPVPIFPKFFFLGGGEGGMRSVGTICWQNLKIRFLFQDGRHCHLRRFILFTFYQKDVCNITFPMTSRMITLFLTPSFLTPARRSWGGVGLYVCPAVLLFGRLFVCTRFDSGADLWVDFLNFAHTHPLGGDGCRCAFWILWNFNYLNGRPSAIISFNMPDIWPHFDS